jgi:filamentous hemagglutinin family protein
MNKIIIVLAALWIVSPAGTSSAVVATDGSLGTGTTLGGPNYNIAATLGQIRNNNLFHSFSQFNLTSGEIATFSGPANITNIISRITGGPSSIDGTIRSTINGANLYLLNPAGIMFGPNASLDVSGSFHATTADYLKLGANGIFYADPSGATNLTIDPPSAFGFLKQSPASISVNGSYLAVPQGKSISLVSGGITMTDANIWAYDGTINLVSVASPGEVAYNGSSMTLQGFSALGPIRITESRDFLLQPYYDNLRTRSDGSFVTPWAPPEMIGLTTANLDSSGMGGGRIFIRSSSFYMSNSSMYNDSYGAAAAGSTDIAASGAVTLARSQITANSYGTAKSAAISISGLTQQISDSNIVTDAFNGADGSNVTLRAADSLIIEGASRISTDADSAGSRAGTLSIDAPNVSILKGATVSSSAPVVGAKGAGSIIIDANRALTVAGNLLSYTVDGQSGSITIRGGNLDVTGQGIISTRIDVPPAITGNQGRAGDIAITANNVTLSDSGRIESNVISSSDGSGGNIAIHAVNVSLLGQSSISASVNSVNGTGGNIAVNASNSILVASRPVGLVKEIGSIASDTSSGNAGHISLEANYITVNNGATVSTYGIPGSTGSAGNITVSAISRLTVENGALNTQSASSFGGNISIASPGIVKVTNGEITASATAGAGNGGNVTINAGYLTLNNGVITAQAEFGNGGNLLINVGKKFVKSYESILSASSRYGQQGTVVVNAPNTDVTGALAPPTYDILNLNAFIPRRCMAPDEMNASTFRLLGSDGLPAGPESSFPIF